MTSGAKRLVKARKIQPSEVGSVEQEDGRILGGPLDGQYFYFMFSRLVKLEEIVEKFEERHGFKPLRIFRSYGGIFAGPAGRVDLAPLTSEEKGLAEEGENAIQELEASQVHV